MRTVGLWLFDILTLFHYSMLMTSQFYLMMTEFLARPQDRQVRPALVFTRPDERMLRCQSVEGRDLAALPIVVGQHGAIRTQRGSAVDDFYGGATAMRQQDFDPMETAIVAASNRSAIPEADDPVAAEDIELVVMRDGLRLRAASPGRSLLVLPVQYSHCWTMSDPLVKLLRVNLMQLGVVFSNSIDAEMRLQMPPFGNPSCRMEDLRDMTRLKIREVRGGAQ